MSGFKLLLAVSEDGYVARGPRDDMRWTGPRDKFLFKLLSTTGGVLLAGRRTAEVLPPLSDRTVIALSRDPSRGITLEQAHSMYNGDGKGAWLIGGAEVAEEALRQRMVARAFICKAHCRFLGKGIPFAPIAELLPPEPTYSGRLEDVLLSVYMGLNHGA